MAKTIRISASEVGADVTFIDIYHTEITGSNLITGSITREGLLNGLDLIVEDGITQFFAQASGSTLCFPNSGSIYAEPYVQGTRYFKFFTEGTGTVEETYPFAVGPTGSFTQTVNFNIYPQISVQASAVYPIEFDGWYDAATGGSLLTTDNPITITQFAYTGSYLDRFYARFS